MHKVSAHVREGAKIWPAGACLKPCAILSPGRELELDEISHWLRIHARTDSQPWYFSDRSPPPGCGRMNQPLLGDWQDYGTESQTAALTHSVSWLSFHLSLGQGEHQIPNFPVLPSSDQRGPRLSGEASGRRELALDRHNLWPIIGTFSYTSAED